MPSRFGQGFSSNGLGLGGGFNFGFYTPTRPIVTAGLLMHLDAGNAASYPGSGTTWSDLTGNGNNATLYNTPTYSADNGGIISFDKNSFEYAATTGTFASITNWTVEAWVKFNAAPVAGTNAIVTNQYDLISNLNFSLGTNDPANNVIRAGFFNGQWRNTTTGQSVVVGSWYHMVGTYNGSTVLMYSNNSQVGTLTYSGTPATGGAIRIARRWDDSATVANNFISAAIPIVRIYNRALTADEIAINYNAASRRYGL